MDAIRSYLKGLQQTPFPPVVETYDVPEVTSDGPLRTVELAAQTYLQTVHMVLSADQLVAMRQWGERMVRINAWLDVLDAGDDVDRAAAAMAALPAVGDGAEQDSETTVFDDIQALAVSQRKCDADRASLREAIAFYLAAVDRTVVGFTGFLQSCDDVGEQMRHAVDVSRRIDGYARRLTDIQKHSEAGSGTRPVV